MAKYLGLVSGTQTEIAGLTTSTGAADQFKLVQTNSAGTLDSTLMPSGLGLETISILTSENLSAGNVVNIWNNAGTANVRKADASNGRLANGFVLAGTTSGQNATVYLEGTVTGVSGLTAGAKVFLSATTAGTVTNTAPSTAGQTLQQIGYALSTSSFTFSPSPEITLA